MKYVRLIDRKPVEGFICINEETGRRLILKPEDSPTGIIATGSVVMTQDGLLYGVDAYNRIFPLSSIYVAVEKARA